MRKQRISDDIIGFNLYSHLNEVTYLITNIGMPHPGARKHLCIYYDPLIRFYSNEFGNITEWEKEMIKRFGTICLYDKTSDAIYWKELNEHLL